MAIMLAVTVLLTACGERTNPINAATSVRVLVENDGPLGKELDRKYGDKPVHWCGGKGADWCSGKLFVEIENPEKVQALAAFVNERLDGWGTPWYSAPIPEVKIQFYDGETLTGTFGSGPNFFSRTQMSWLSRSASSAEVRQFLNLVGVDPAKLGRPPR